MANQAGGIVPDDSHANFYKLFKIAKPEGTITEFHEWLLELKEHQETVKPCPWCKSQPALRVVPGQDHKLAGCLFFTVACENDYCQVNPELNECFDTPEEAIGEWQWNTPAPVAGQ